MDIFTVTSVLRDKRLPMIAITIIYALKIDYAI